MSRIACLPVPSPYTLRFSLFDITKIILNEHANSQLKYSLTIATLQARNKEIEFLEASVLT
jgi:hypothetical protein